MGAASVQFRREAAIRRFRELVETDAPLSHLQPLLALILPGLRMTCQTIPIETSLYRGRLHEKGRLFQHISELRYPPPALVKARSRFNDIGQSVLYASNTELGTLIELRPELHKLFVIAEIRARYSDRPLYLRLTAEPALESNSCSVRKGPERPLSKAERTIQAFVLENVSRPGEAGYLASIAIAKRLFGARLVSAPDAPIDGHSRMGVIYPSVYAPEICNVPTYNIAMRPDTFDECYDIVHAHLYSLTFDRASDRVVMTSHNEAKIGVGGNLLWMHSFKEMVARTQKGVFGNGIFEPRVSPVWELM